VAAKRYCESCGKAIRSGEHINVKFCSERCSKAKRLAEFLNHVAKYTSVRQEAS
jgi:predicted nucleic acid-binding Zn ribbon protein